MPLESMMGDYDTMVRKSAYPTKRWKSRQNNEDMEWALYGLLRENEKLRNKIKFLEFIIVGKPKPKRRGRK